MPISITAETEAKLRERASHNGQDINSFAERILADYLEGRIGHFLPNVLSISDEDADALDDAVAAGDADFATGRFKSLEELRADKRERFGLSL